jgi:hypothetical protein
LLFLPYLRPKDTKRAVEALSKPLFNVVIDTPQEELARAGLKVAVYPVQSYWTGRTPSWEEFNTFIGATEATELAKRYRIV